MNRRGFLKSLGAGVAIAAAPAIVRAESLMRVWVPPEKPCIILPAEEARLISERELFETIFMCNGPLKEGDFVSIQGTITGRWEQFQVTSVDHINFITRLQKLPPEYGDHTR